MAVNTSLGRSRIKCCTDADGHTAPAPSRGFLHSCQRILYNNSYNLIIHYLKRNVSVWPPAPCNNIGPFHSRFLSRKLRATAQPRNSWDSLQGSPVPTIRTQVFDSPNQHQWASVILWLWNYSESFKKLFCITLEFFPLDGSTVH